jgi:SAM-dependent methyltransferase
MASSLATDLRRVASRLRGGLRSLKARLRVASYALRPAQSVDEHRYAYQKAHIRHVFSPGEQVLDAGSGNDPFPYATVIADRYLEPTQHRSAALETDGKPLVRCDIQALPFAAGQFDYVFCSHVLEHVDDPLRACRELQRVARAGFIETPTLMKDALFSWAKGMHKWYLQQVGGRLVFLEYGPRELEGTRSQAWWQTIFGPAYHPLQAVFRDNQDLFNVMFEWQEGFGAIVLRLDGQVQSLEPNDQSERQMA